MQSKNHTGGSRSSAVHNDSRGARHAHAGGTAAAHAATELGEVREELGTLGDTARESAPSLVEGGSLVARSAATAARTAGIDFMDPVEFKQFLEREAGRPVADPLAELSKLDGADFERRFGELMDTGHADAIRQLEAMMAGLRESSVRDLVNKTLTTLRHHQEMAQGMTDTR